MKKIFVLLNTINKRYPLALPILIVCLGLFFRLFRFKDFLGFGHDEDLGAWIVKDILTGHLRLIGQETSIGGVFIGPLFYYLLLPFYWVFRMSPLASMGFVSMSSIATIFSIYFVYSKFFGKVSGLIGSLIYSVSMGVVMLDRWVVPTQMTMLWSVWFLYCLLCFIKGYFKALPILLVLIGLIWHVHIAFIPLVAGLVPLSIFLSGFIKKTWPGKKAVVIGLILMIILILPLVVFEYKNGFGQIHSLLTSVNQDRGEAVGIFRFQRIAASLSRALTNLILVNHSRFGNLPDYLLFLSPLTLVVLLVTNYRLKLFKSNQTLILSAWFLVNILSHMISKRAISEYYFNNLFIVLLLAVSVFLAFLYFKINKLLPTILLSGYFLINFNWLLILPKIPDGYLVREQMLKLITQDVKLHNYPCVGVNYIAGPGGSAGMRYLFYYYGINIITPGNDIPVYNIVVPHYFAEKEVNVRFGNYGVILPRRITSIDPKVCFDPNRQFLPLLGFYN